MPSSRELATWTWGTTSLSPAGKGCGAHEGAAARLGKFIAGGLLAFGGVGYGLGRETVSCEELRRSGCFSNTGVTS